MKTMDIRLLRQLLEHDPETGQLTWLPRDLSMFPNERQGKIWNTRFAGKEAFTATRVEPSGSAYKEGRILGHGFLAHRVLWALHFGEWPNADIDHINGDGTDNRICNLRSVSRQTNLRNTRKRCVNKSGYMGVSRVGDKYRARIGAKPTVQLGMFETYEEAVSARKEAERQLGYHPNHGRA